MTAPTPKHTPEYPVDATNRLKRRHDRGFYDHATVHDLLDAAVLAHVAYVMVVSRMWWKFRSGVLRACNVGSSQAARSRDIGTRG